MRYKVIVVLVFVFSLCFNLASGQTQDSLTYLKAIEKLGFSPREFHKQEAQAKQEALARFQRNLASFVQPLNQNDFDVTYYKLDIYIVVDTEIIYGKVTTRAKSLVPNLNAVDLDLTHYLTVDSVLSSGTPLTFSQANDLLSITLDRSYFAGEEFSVLVYYHGRPATGGLQGFSWGYHGYPSFPIVSSLSEPFMARGWWPCKDAPDDKADSADMIIKIRSDMTVASNGLLRSTTNNPDGTKTFWWHEKYPITTYLISIAATNYQTFSHWYNYAPGKSMEVKYFVYPEYYSQAQSGYSPTVGAIQYFSNTFGQYPFVEEKYGHAQFGWSGAMEHQTCTSMLYSWYDTWMIVHELSHQWWGDLITCQNWHEIWLNEGFASYSEALYYENLYGLTYYHDYMAGMDYTGGKTVWVYDTTDAWEIFDNVVYDKGAWVVHMLRHVVGDSTFFNILRDCYKDSLFAYKTTSTERFKIKCEQLSGKELDYFFQEWIFGTYRPNYLYSWISESAGNGTYNVYLHIRQTQTTSPTFYTMPLDVTISTGQGDFTYNVFNDINHLDFTFNVPASPTNIQIDKDNWVMKNVSSESYGFNIVTTTPKEGYLDIPYAETLSAKGGTPPYKWRLIQGMLPIGCSLDTLTGVISGTPLVVTTTYNFTVRAYDSSLPQKIDVQTLSLLIGPTPYVRGDANKDETIDIGDIVYLINYVFYSGTPPQPQESGDVNCDSLVDINDIVHLINFVFYQGSAPC
jgi:aminopeptidase N